MTEKTDNIKSFNRFLFCFFAGINEPIFVREKIGK